MSCPNPTASQPTPTNTPTLTPTATDTPINTPTATDPSTPTTTNTATDTPTDTPTATDTSTPMATNTATNTPTNTPTATNTPTNSPTNSPTPTPTPKLLQQDIWEAGSITAGQIVWYYFNGTAGQVYKISWDDSYQGSGNYTGDIKVSCFRADRTTSYFLTVDSGYTTPQQITAAATESLYLKVQGYTISSSGTFAIKYFDFVPTSTPTPTATKTPTNTPTNSSTPTNTATNTPTPTNTPIPFDITFSGDGIQTTVIGTGRDVGKSVAIQTDGKIVVAGNSNTGTYDSFAVVRYNTDGSLDTTFSGDGIQTTAIGNYNAYGNSVALQADGKIVVAGYTADGSNDDFAVVRYNSDGSLDTTFSGDGIQTTGIGIGSDKGYSVAIQADGKIVVAGYSEMNFDEDFAVVRYNTDGSLDTTFSGDGKQTTDIEATYNEGRSVAIQADGKIIVAGYSLDTNCDFEVVRYNTDGSLDTTFDSDGKQTTDFNSWDFAYSVAIQTDGKIIVVGDTKDTYGYIIAVVRYNADGSLDTTFSSDGRQTTDIGSDTSDDSGYSVAIQTNGKIVVAGQFNDGRSDFAVIRYNTDGSLDTSFSGDGIQITAITTESDAAYSVAIQADGKIVAAGYSINDTTYFDFAVVRYLP
jgi:uncharacterized delta-60 repeat protein